MVQGLKESSLKLLFDLINWHIGTCMCLTIWNWCPIILELLMQTQKSSYFRVINLQLEINTCHTSMFNLHSLAICILYYLWNAFCWYLWIEIVEGTLNGVFTLSRSGWSGQGTLILLTFFVILVLDLFSFLLFVTLTWV